MVASIMIRPKEQLLSAVIIQLALTDIDNKLHDSTILAKQSPNGVWFLNANLVIAKGATFHIDSTDTKCI